MGRLASNWTASNWTRHLTRWRRLLTFLVMFIVAVPLRLSAEQGIEVERCEVQFLEEVEVPALSSGVLQVVRCKENQEVARGGLLAELDESLLLIRRQTAKLERDAAAAKLADDVELQFALAAQRESEAELLSNKTLAEKNPGVVTETLLRRLRIASERASLEVEQARKGRKLAEISLAIRSAELQLIDQQLDRLRIVAPIEGIVREVQRKSGEWVAEGQPIAKVARMDRLRIDAFVSSSLLAVNQRVGARIAVRWKSEQQERVSHGRISSFDPQVYAGGRLRCHAEVDNEREGGEWKLLPGMEVRMTIYPR